MGAKDWTYIRRQCMEMDVKTECSNGGEYLRGTHPWNETNVAIRVLREAEIDYGFKDGLYLTTALMIVEQMNAFGENS